MESSVSDVRSFLRFRLLQTREREFHRWRGSSVGKLALVQMHRARRAGRGVRIVRDHDDGLAVLAVERLEQAEDFVAGLAVEIAGRLVAEQQRRIGDDGARDADALLFAAGKLCADNAVRCERPTTFKRGLHVLACAPLWKDA